MTDYQLWPATNGPASTTADAAVNLATEFYVNTSGLYAKALRFYRPTTGLTGTVTGRIYTVINGSSGTALTGTDVTFTLSGTGWHTATFASPVALTANQRYRAVVNYPSGYPATSGYWTTGGPGSAGISNGPLQAPNTAAATAGDQGSYFYGGTLAYTVSSSGSSCYWVDVTVTDVTGSVPTNSGYTVVTGQTVVQARKVAVKTSQGAAQAQSIAVGRKVVSRASLAMGAATEIPLGLAVRRGVALRQVAGQTACTVRRSGFGVSRSVGGLQSTQAGGTPRVIGVTSAALQTGRYAGALVAPRWGGRRYVRNPS